MQARLMRLQSYERVPTDHGREVHRPYMTPDTLLTDIFAVQSSWQQMELKV